MVTLDISQLCGNCISVVLLPGEDSGKSDRYSIVRSLHSLSDLLIIIVNIIIFTVTNITTVIAGSHLQECTDGSHANRHRRKAVCVIAIIYVLLLLFLLMLLLLSGRRSSTRMH